MVSLVGDIRFLGIYWCFLLVFDVIVMNEFVRIVMRMMLYND